MPHCETCDRFYNPNTLNQDGTCPTCGKQVGEPPTEEKISRVEHEGSPWHFKLVIGVFAVYLAFRLVQGIVWAAHHI